MNKNNNLAVLVDAAFAGLKPELDKLTHGPRSSAELFDRIVGVTPSTSSREPESPLASTGKLLTVAQAGKFCGVGPRSILNWVRSGKLPCLRAGRKTIRISELALAEFLNGGK